LLVFRYELDDALLHGAPAAFDARALTARLESIADAKGVASDVWTSGSKRDRFDIYYTDARGQDRTMRVNGVGEVLRDEPNGSLASTGAAFEALHRLHTSLYAGRAGEWIVAMSGLLLVTNLVIGLKLGWPRGGRRREALLPRVRGSLGARRLTLHRSIGLWIALPLVLVAACGVALVFRPEIEAWLRAGIDAPTRTAAGADRATPWITPDVAVRVAMARLPDATLTALVLPEQERPWYRVRLLTPAEGARIWGTTTLFVDAGSGRVLSDHRAERSSSARAFVDLLYPLHTGQQGGMVLRALLLAISVLLITLVVLGLRRALAPASKGGAS
jgi:uncharacterized iron-regulated membrane protein